MDHKAYSQIIANRIVALCKKRGISVHKLAGMSGISQAGLEHLVNGRTFDPKLKTIHKIANAFNMTPAEFLDFEELSAYSFDEETDDDE